MVVGVMEAIGDGLDPSPYAFDAEIIFGVLQFNGAEFWVRGYERRDDGPMEAVGWPVLAIDLAAGWALTLHGLFRFDPDKGKPSDEETLFPEDDAPPSPGGRP